MNDLKVDQEIDCRGLNCPLPILKTKKATMTMESGQILKMTCTDAGSTKDMPAWSSRTGHPIVKSEEAAGDFIYYIQVK